MLLLELGLANQGRLLNPEVVLNLSHGRQYVDDTMPGLVSESSTPAFPSAAPSTWDSARADLAPASRRRDQQRRGGSPTQHRPPPPPPSMHVTQRAADITAFGPSDAGQAQDEEAQQLSLLLARSAHVSESQHLSPPSPPPSQSSPSWRPPRRQTGTGLLGERTTAIGSAAQEPLLLLTAGEDVESQVDWAERGPDVDLFEEKPLPGGILPEAESRQQRADRARALQSYQHRQLHPEAGNLLLDLQPEVLTARQPQLLLHRPLGFPRAHEFRFKKHASVFEGGWSDADLAKAQVEPWPAAPHADAAFMAARGEAPSPPPIESMPP